MCQAKFVTNKDIKTNLKALCEWAISYMENASVLNNVSAVKGHIVYYSVCHAIFHIIAIRIDDVSELRIKGKTLNCYFQLTFPNCSFHYRFRRSINKNCKISVQSFTSLSQRYCYNIR